jgi:hypothetical protein
VIAVPKPLPRWSWCTPIGSISPGLPGPADHTVTAATASSWSNATRLRASAYGEPAAIACQRSTVNVDFSNDALITSACRCA